MVSERGAHDLTAAATRYSIPIGQPVSTDKTRQVRAWDFYSDSPEVRFAAHWVGNAMGRATLFAGRVDDEGKIAAVETGHPAIDLVRQIAGGAVGQAQLLTEFGPHLTVAGEGWVVIAPRANSQVIDWHVVSILEVSERGKSLEVEIDGRKMTVPAYDPSVPVDPNDTSPLAIRIWMPDPRRHVEADSPIFSSFVLLEELRLLNAAVAAIAKSRLVGRGVFVFPKGSTFPTTAGPGGADEDDLMETFMQVARIAYEQPNSAAAGVPLLMALPDNATGSPEHITFESNFDELAIKLREETIRRFATGLDTPPEVLLGQGDMNHWGVWASNADALRLAVEPKLKSVCDALTEQFLQPALHALNVADADECVVWYDPSGMQSRTNQVQTALELRKLQAIGGETLRREAGLADTDAPTDQEILEDKIRWIIPAVPPEFVAPLLKQLGIDITADVPPAPPVVNPGAPPVIPPSPFNAPPKKLPANGPPDDMSPAPEGLLAAADALVTRALERAGQRLRSSRPRAERSVLEEIEASVMHVATTVEEDQLDKLLAGAWVAVPAIADRYSVDAACLREQLDQYTRELLAAGVPHEWQHMPAAIAEPCPQQSDIEVA